MADAEALPPPPKLMPGEALKALKSLTTLRLPLAPPELRRRSAVLPLPDAAGGENRGCAYGVKGL